MRVPHEHPKKARRFNGGLVGRPFGTFFLWPINPRLKPWAIVGCLSEALPLWGKPNEPVPA